MYLKLKSNITSCNTCNVWISIISEDTCNDDELTSLMRIF